MSLKRMIWTIVYREERGPQQETIRYTAEAANTYARTVIEQGGIALVIEGDEDLPEVDGEELINPANKGTLQW